MKTAAPRSPSRARILGSGSLTAEGVAGALAQAELPIFVISTFESDYVLVRSAQLARAADALEEAGHVFAA